MKPAILIAFLALLLTGCKKSGYLSANPNDDQVIPDKISKLQAILDNTFFMNGDLVNAGLNPIIGEAAADDYYIIPGGFEILKPYATTLRNIHTWNDNIYSEGMLHTDWSFPYRAVFYANSVLNGLAEIKDPTATQKEIDHVKGSALFFRAEMFYQLAQIYAPHYNKNTAASQWGIVLKYSADINEKVERSSVAATYERIVQDLVTAIPLLDTTPLYKTRPSKPAACALLARVYLTMHEYAKALEYASLCLQMHPQLIDYNTINALPGFKSNDEIIFHSLLINTEIHFLFNGAISRVDSLLYKQYAANDLRKKLFFNKTSFKGSYSGNSMLWGGVATDEVLLIRAECRARTGSIGEARNDLNSLLVKRFVSGTFVPLTTTDANELLKIILAERRKELLFRGLRWTDLRRLNSEGANITITRDIAGKKDSLGPNDPHYTFLIPPEVIGFNPGMPQNPR